MSLTETVLITGSSGFIGSTLAQKLSSKYKIIGLDQNIPKNKIENVSYYVFDINSEASIQETLHQIKEELAPTVTSVVHLVAYYSFEGKEDPRYDSITVNGTRVLLKYLQENFEVEQFIYSSSMLVYKPVKIGKKLQDNSPIAPSWPYPNSKIKTEKILKEERGKVKITNLRIAGVYNDDGRQPTLVNQIARVNEGWVSSMLFPGNPESGQSVIHVDDLVDGIDLFIEQRNKLEGFDTFAFGEDEVMTYKDVQAAAGNLLHLRPWPVIRIPQFVAKIGAKVMEHIPFMRTPFIKPWMVPHAEEHFDVDISRLKKILHWEPQKKLKNVLPEIIQRLKDDPDQWYAVNKIEKPFYRPLSIIGSDKEKNLYFAAMANIFLGIWLMANPFSFHGLTQGEILAELGFGLAIITVSFLSLIPTLRWVKWINALLGMLLMFSPLVADSSSDALYLGDTMIGGLILLFSCYTPGTLEEDRETGIPPGWTYNPSTAGQRVPIMLLAFGGFLLSRYLASYQLGHIPDIWDPFFGDGTKRVLTSDVSKAFPISDAGLGALTYLLDVISACIGGRTRWKSMPWAVILFGFMIIPAGVTSITLIMLQPISVGAWCAVCLMTAFIMLIMVPPAVDEVVASVQFLRRRYQAGEPFWRVFWLGSEVHESEEIPFVEKEGTSIPLYLSTAIGIWLMFAPAFFQIEGIAADNIYITASLITTFAVIAISEVARVVRLLNIPLGIWLVLSAWPMGNMNELAQWHSTLAGFLLILLSLPGGKKSERFGTAEKIINWKPLKR